jgi:hypothetical protein
MSSAESYIRIQEQLLDIDPDDPTLWQTSGTLHLAYGIEEDRYEEALTDFDRTLDLDPENASALQMRGNVYLLLDRSDEAVADLRVRKTGSGLGRRSPPHVCSRRHIRPAVPGSAAVAGGSTALPRSRMRDARVSASRSSRVR